MQITFFLLDFDTTDEYCYWDSRLVHKTLSAFYFFRL